MTLIWLICWLVSGSPNFEGWWLISFALAVIMDCAGQASGS